MKLTNTLKQLMNKSVLCWLASSSKENIPNVSPKEVFTYYKTNSIIIANIASPQTVKNIKANENVCVSFIDVFVQKGFQIKGKAVIIDQTDSEFAVMEKELVKITQGKFPFPSIIRIHIEKVKLIIAPSYIFYPDITEEEQIASAKKNYGI